ncbi:MAG: GNAT family N-acetyltransferase, partial [Nocardioides sp.]
MPAPSPHQVFPVLGLRIRSGVVELRGIDDEDLMRLADLAARGVHDPDRMPFGVPWTEVPAGELPRRFAQHHWM